MQHNLSWTNRAISRIFLLLFYTESKENILRNHCQKYFSLHLNIYFNRIRWFEATQSFLPGCASNFINAPLLYCWHWAKSFLTATLFHNFQKIFSQTGKEQRKLILTRFSLENILSSLVLETATMNNIRCSNL